MATVEQVILDSSTLSTGNTVEDHLNNLGVGAGGLIEVSSIKTAIRDTVKINLKDDVIIVKDTTESIKVKIPETDKIVEC